MLKYTSELNIDINMNTLNIFIQINYLLRQSA